MPMSWPARASAAAVARPMPESAPVMIAVMRRRYPGPGGIVRAVPRVLLFALTLVACLLLVIAELGDLNQIQILTVTKDGVGVGGHHGYALLIIAVVAAVMAFGAWRGSRPAAFAVAALGAAALLIVLLVDLPDVDATGLYGRNYEEAKAVADTGFRLETIGAILLLFTGVITSVLGQTAGGSRPDSRRRPGRRGGDSAPARPPAEDAAGGG